MQFLLRWMSVEIIQYIRGPGAGAEAALSQSSQQGLDQLMPANRPTFDAAGHQPQVRQQGRIHHACCVQAHPFQKQPSVAWWCCLGVFRAGSRWRGRDADWLIRFTVAGIRRCGIIQWGKTGGLAAPMGRLLTIAALAVASFFVRSSLEGSIVLGTTSVRALPSMLFPAAERAV